MRAGPLRDRVTIEALTTAKDAGGGVEESYAPVAERWAEVMPFSARERVLAGMTAGRLLLRVRLRYYEGLSTRHRFRVGSRILNISSVMNPDGRKEEHLAECVETV